MLPFHFRFLLRLRRRPTVAAICCGLFPLRFFVLFFMRNFLGLPVLGALLLVLTHSLPEGQPQSAEQEHPPQLQERGS